MAKGLKGRRIIVTRARGQAGEFSGLLRARGAVVEEIPTIEIVPPLSWEEADRAADRLDGYDWLILTSANGARFFFPRVRARRGGLGALSGLKICAIGPRTRAAVEKEGLEVAFMPTEYVAEALIAQTDEEAWRGKRILLARAEVARDVVPREMRRLGAEIDVVTVYRTVRPAVSRERLRELLAGGGAADAVTFTSSSTVKNFAGLFEGQDLAGLLAGVAVACIGPVTAETAGELGLVVDVVPDEHTIPGLTDALEKHFGAEG